MEIGIHGLIIGLLTVHQVLFNYQKPRYGREQKANGAANGLSQLFTLALLSKQMPVARL